MPGEDHGQPGRVGRRDHLGVAHRAARLDHRRRPRPRPRRAARRRRERTHPTPPPTPRSAAPPGPAASAMSCALRAAIRVESTRLICPAPMPDRGPVLGIDDGVRLHVLGHGPGEAAGRAISRLASAPAGSPPQRPPRPASGHVAVLHQEPARDLPEGQRRRRADRAAPPVVSSRRFFFAANTARAASLGLRRDHHLGEDLRRSPPPSPRPAAGSAPRCRRRPRSGRSRRPRR